MRGLDRRRFLAGVAVLALPAARAATPLGWLSGLTTDGGSGGDPDAVRAWGEWRGAPVGIVNLKSRRNADWRHLANSFRQKEPVYDALNGMGVRVSQTLPLWPQDSGSADPLKDCAAGAFDGHHREIARMLAGYRPLPGMVLRLAHECSSASQRDWIGLDPDRVRFPTWRAAWRRVGSIYLDAIPGLGLEWNHIRRPAIDVRGGYPGDDLVAIVGVDCYNNGEAIVDDASWNEYADRGAAGRRGRAPGSATPSVSASGSPTPSGRSPTSAGPATSATARASCAAWASCSVTRRSTSRTSATSTAAASAPRTTACARKALIAPGTRWPRRPTGSYGRRSAEWADSPRLGNQLPTHAPARPGGRPSALGRGPYRSVA